MFSFFYAHHDWEDDGKECGFEDPEDSQTDQLDEGEQMDPPERHMPQEGEVWLVLGWHQVELDALPELDQERSMDINALTCVDCVYKVILSL